MQQAITKILNSPKIDLFLSDKIKYEYENSNGALKQLKRIFKVICWSSRVFHVFMLINQISTSNN